MKGKTPGVTWSKKLNKWVARFNFEKTNHYVGSFDDIKLAIKARGIWSGKIWSRVTGAKYNEAV